MEAGAVEETQRSDSTQGAKIRTGGSDTDFRRLLDNDAEDGFNFWFIRSHHKPEGGDPFRTPRHNHAFQQIGFVEEGERDWAPGQVITKGCISYMPRGCWYGPQNLDKPCISWGIQFGFNGEQQRGHYWESRRIEAIDRLKQRGTFENGTFVETDPVTGKVTVRDAMDALYDERLFMLKGRHLVVPPARYEVPIIMRPENYEYFPAGLGVELKHLGRFYDQSGPNGDVSISLARLSGGAYPLRAERPQLCWTLSAGLEVDGRIYPERAYAYSPRGEEGEIKGEGGIEVYLVEFPHLD
jgi:hypothetical protein